MNAVSLQLTPREAQVLKLVCEGREYREVAGVLGMGVRTVKARMWRVYLKAGINQRRHYKKVLLLQQVVDSERAQDGWVNR
jgi:DNA-binding CsgD family transcriptional regulator